MEDKIPEDVMQKINSTMFMTGGNTENEKKIHSMGFKDGYSLAASIPTQKILQDILNECQTERSALESLMRIVKIIEEYKPEKAAEGESQELISDAREVLERHIPADCYWPEMDHLVNCPVKYILKAMEQYANQKVGEYITQSTKKMEE